MRPLLLLSLAPTFAFGVTLIDFNSLPSCASNCKEFTDAQDNCVPPRIAATTMATYFSCFCESGLLTSFKASGTGICTTSTCSAADLTTIQSWYNQYCSGPVPTEDESSVVTVTRTPSGTAASAATGGASTTSGAISVKASTGPPRSWISTHYGWVIFLIVLFLLMGSGFFFGMWFRKRRARLERERLESMPAQNPSAVFSLSSRPMSTVLDSQRDVAGVPASNPRHSILSRSRTGTVSSYTSPVVWGPHQHQAHSNGYEYPAQSASPVSGVPVPQPTYGPRFSRDRISTVIPPDEHGEPSPPASPVTGTGNQSRRSVSPISFHQVDATQPHAISDGLGDAVPAGSLHKKSSNKLSKRGSMS